MGIKLTILLSSLFLSLNMNCHSQERDSGFLKIPVYQVSPCLHGLLTAVVESNKENYSGDKFFYSLIFEKGKNKRYINVVSERWAESRYLDYKGVLKIDSMFFLLRGGLDSDSIFRKATLPEVKVKIHQAKDSIDNNAFFIEPSLQGVYQECRGMPIYMEIYTKSKIKYFDMKVLPSVPE